MRFRRKKKEDALVETSVADAPSEVATPPVEFVTMEELMQKVGLAGALGAGGEGEEPEVDESPKWEISIEGMQPLESGGVKFSVFTPGENSSGQMVVEVRAKPGMNAGVFSWLQKPLERKVKMVVSDHEGERIEQWEMTAIPVAIAVDELDREVKDPWFTTLQMSVKGIRIT